MSTVAEIKSALHQQVANTQDERVLSKMHLYFQSLKKSDKRIVAINSLGQSLTSKQYVEEIRKSITQHKLGKVVKQGDLEKEL